MKKERNGIDATAPFNHPDAVPFPGKNQRGINHPGIELPAFNPPVPNRAWTAMKAGMDIDALKPEDIEDMRLN